MPRNALPWTTWPIAMLLTAWGIVRHLAAPQATAQVAVDFYAPSLLLMAAGCAPWAFPGRRSSRAPADGLLSRRVGIACVLLVLGLATSVRLVALDRWPPPTGTAFEEAQLGQQANQALSDGTLPREHLLAILAPALAFKLFGTGLTILRLPFIGAGALLPLLVFLACRRLVCLEAALFATGLLAVSWWSVASARIADEIFFPAWILPLVLWNLVSFTESARPMAAFGLAAFASVLAYEYTGYHIVPVLLAAYLAKACTGRTFQWLRSSPRPPAIAALAAVARTWGPGLLVIAVVSADILMPRLVGDLILGEHYFAEGFARHAGSGCSLAAVPFEDLPSHAATRLGAALRVICLPRGGEDIPYLGSPGYPLLDPMAALALLVAGSLVLLTLRRRLHGFVLVWVVVAVAVATLFPCTLNPHRFYTVLPLLFVLVALGAQVLWETLPRKPQKKALAVSFALIVVASAQWNLPHLWKDVLHGKRAARPFEDAATRVSLWLSHLEPDALVWLLAERYEFLGQPNDYYWLLDGRQVVTADSLPAVLPSPELPGGPLYYLLISQAEQAGFANVVEHFYPGARRLDPEPIAIAGMDVQMFRIDRASKDAARRPHGSPHGFKATYASSRSSLGPEGPSLPSDAKPLLERQEYYLSELSIPLSLKKRFRDEAALGVNLWCVREGAFDSAGATESSFRLYVSGGEAWLGIGARTTLHATAPPRGAVSRSVRAPLEGRETSFRLVYRLGPGEFVGVQLYRTMPDGRERVLTAPFGRLPDVENASGDAGMTTR
jgi:hypothetical protein